MAIITDRWLNVKTFIKKYQLWQTIHCLNALGLLVSILSEIAIIS